MSHRHNLYLRNWKVLKAQLAVRSGLHPDVLEQLREELAKLPSHQLVARWFGPETSPPHLVRIRDELATRKALFAWVYGASAGLLEELPYVRPPSSAKFWLVNRLLSSVRAEFRWMTSRTIHAFAFRPESFERRTPPKRPDGTLRPSWGRLYETVKINKGRGVRTLHVPNPPLMRVLRDLLGIIGPSQKRALLPCVYGAGKGGSGPTFENAAAHRRQDLIATFDLKDFFPSVDIGDVILGLRRARDLGVPMLEPSASENERTPKAIAWTDDAILLVAKLATYRSRLPQGSPLSPLLANLAFSACDERIQRALAEEFGNGSFIYTRYFDDLTVSISRSAARKFGSDASRFQEVVSKLLQENLEGTSFSLNPRKSRSSCLRPELAGTSGAHRVTGLVVRRESVTLPRDLKRYIRETAHRLSKGDFVTQAAQWKKERSRTGRADFVSLERGHRWRAVLGSPRRCSAERLAALMLIAIYPDLKVRLDLQDWATAVQSGQAPGLLPSGAMSRLCIEGFLPYLWRNHLAIRDEKPNQVVLESVGKDRVGEAGAEGKRFLTILAESSLDFFRLPGEDAIAVVEYWHHLRGLLGYLGACPAGEEFSEIRRYRDLLAGCAKFPMIQASRHDAASPPEDDLPFTGDEVLADLSLRVHRRYVDLARKLGGPSDSRLLQAFGRRARDAREWRDWIDAASKLFLEGLPFHPMPAVAPDDDVRSVMEYLRLERDLQHNRVSGEYSLLRRFHGRFDVLSEGLSPITRFFRMQRGLCLMLDKWLLHADRLAAGSGGMIPSENWQTNLWSRRLDRRLDAAIQRLRSMLDSLRSSPGQAKVFLAGSGFELDRESPLLHDASGQWTSSECWRHLSEVCNVLCRVTREVMDMDSFAEIQAEVPKGMNHHDSRKAAWMKLEELHADPATRTRLRLVAWLRNRGAHAMTPDRRGEWLKLQKQVAKLLGRDFQPATGKDPQEIGYATDLQMTGHEALIFKIELIETHGEFLESVSRDERWKRA